MSEMLDRLLARDEAIREHGHFWHNNTPMLGFDKVYSEGHRMSCTRYKNGADYKCDCDRPRAKKKNGKRASKAK